MKHILFFVAAILWSVMSFGKGHGGGHGGGHSHGGGGHGSMRSTSHTATRPVASHPGATRASNRMQSASRVAGSSNVPVYNRNGRLAVPVHPGYYGYTFEHPWGSPYYNNGYGYGYMGYSPFYFDPFFSMFSFGASFMYTPHYNYAAPPENDGLNLPAMDGYVVFAHDTISGTVKLTPNAVFLENKDSVRGYDYKFHVKMQALEYVSVYNTDGTQLSLARVRAAPKKLWRIVHEGRLNVYDRQFDFIYSPEDIDMRTLMVVYNGEAEYIGSSSVTRTKLRLTEFVNRVYGLDLNPNSYSWKELLVYIDKLD